jgi:gliding motility-associated-like protein
MTVSKATLLFTANNLSKDYLAALPALTYTITGFVNGETQSVLLVLPTIQTTAVQTSNAGAYPITLSGGSNNNYTYTYQAGTLTIGKIAQTITFTAIPTQLQFGDVFSLAATSTSGLTVLFESVYPQFATVSGNQVTGTGQGTARVRAYNAGDQNYLAAEVFGNFSVTTTHKNILHLFTPNGDGFNDYWEIPDLASYGNCDVRIFNRWGKEVYANKNYDNRWDGTSNGSPLPDGAYYFVIITQNAGTITGTVNIVR